MAKKTIAQLREEAIIKLAERKTPNPGAEDLQEAKRVMNSFYRLCGLDERLLYLCNEEQTANKSWVKDMETRAVAWYRRLNDQFKPFNACLVYFGYLPTICELGATRDLYLRFFYN